MKEHFSDELIEHLESTVSLSCNKCPQGKITEWHMDDDAAADLFFDLGWRVSRNKVHCPSCAKKLLTPKKKKNEQPTRPRKRS